MTKYIKILFSLLFLLTLGSCRDDFQWGGIEVGEDEYLLSFTTSTPNIEVMGLTRDGEFDPDAIKDLTLVIFKDEKLWDEPLYFPDAANKLQYSSPSKDEDGNVIPGSITMPKGAVTSGKWYLFANAKSEIKSYISSKDNGATISPETFLSGINYDSNQLSSSTSNVMWGMEPITVGEKDASQTNAVIIGLSRIYSRVSVEVSGDIKFMMTGARLNKWVTTGTLEGKQVSDVTGTVSDTEGWIAPTQGITNESPNFTYAKSGERLVTSTYPYKLNNNAANSNKMMMLVKGRFNNGTLDAPEYGSSDCYYAIPVPSCPRNGGWRIIINGALAAGQTTAQGAIDHPGGLSVVFEDNEPKIHNIVSDGENVLAVVDSVKFNADGTLDGASGDIGTVLIKARQKGTPTTTVTFSSGTYDWILWQGEDWTSTKVPSDEDNGLFTHNKTRELKVTSNSGSERSATYTVKLGDTGLTRNFVIYQKAPENLNYSSIVSIKLTITGGASPATINDYIKFVNPKGTSNTNANDPECKGIQPDENGGRVRNLGLHKPMPNGGDVTYKYEITVLSGDLYKKGEPNKIGKSLTLTFKDTDIPTGETSKYAYVTNSDVYYIKSGDDEYTLDIYHTGFFHKHTSGWYYYEVMQQGTRDLYWLDRNLEASSAGMGVRTSNGVMTSSTWPIMGDKAMGEYYNLSKANTNKPKGWNVPSYAQMRSMTVSSSFTINRMSNPSDHKTYLAPTFTYQGKEDGEVKSFSSYFPQNRLQVGGSVGGDAEAGYYLTQTPAGTTGWYQTMQFMGMNVTSQNINYNSNMSEASVRCCTGNYDPQADATKYTCNVKGYTHVFLYYLNSDGSKTYLTTWPGEQVAVYQNENSNDIGRYHPFEIEPTMSYNTERLFVIFNTVNTQGVRVNSNMSEADVKIRKGTKFVNGGSYDKDAKPKLADVKEGNWVAGSNSDLSGKSVYLRGAFTGSDWQSGIKATTNAQGIAKFEGAEIGTNAFKIYVSSEDKWYSSNSSVAADGEWHSVPANSNSGQNMTVSGASSGSKYDIEWDYVNHKIKITSVGGGTTTDYTSWWVNVIGAYNDNDDNGVHPDATGKSKHSSQAIGNTSFKIKVHDGSDHWYSNGGTIQQDQWVSISGNNDNKMTIAGASAGDIFDVEWDCANNKIKVTKVGGGTTPQKTVKVRGDIFSGNWSSNHERTLERVGTTDVYEAELELNNKDAGEFVIDVNNGTSTTSYVRDDGKGYITFGSPIKAKGYAQNCNFQINKGKYKFSFDTSKNELTITPVGWSIMVKAQYDTNWAEQTLTSSSSNEYYSKDNVLIADGAFVMLVDNGIEEKQYTATSSINTNTWVDIPQTDNGSMTVNGGGWGNKYLVEWNAVKRQIKLTKR